jgi:hypothetical protein
MSDRQLVPPNVLEKIKACVLEFWGDDEEQSREMIVEEIESYHAFQAFDLGEAEPHRDQIIECSTEFTDMWSERLSNLESELNAFRELQSLAADGISSDALDEFRKTAAVEHPESFDSQLGFVNQQVARANYLRDVEATVEPIRRLLVDIERTIGRQCYNANIQNYGPGGVWEGEGRSFRYPIRVLDAEMNERKHWNLPEDISAEALVSGFYKFGSNELSIMRALVDVVHMIEREYGVDLSDDKRRGEDK